MMTLKVVGRFCPGFVTELGQVERELDNNGKLKEKEFEKSIAAFDRLVKGFEADSYSFEKYDNADGSHTIYYYHGPTTCTALDFNFEVAK